jgi:hypothetical protein
VRLWTVTEHISSAGEDETSLQSEEKSAPVPEESEHFLLNKTLATPAVRRIAMENNVRFYLIYCYIKQQKYFRNFCCNKAIRASDISFAPDVDRLHSSWMV